MNHASDYGYSIEGQLPAVSTTLPNWAYYTQAEYDAFGWSTLTRAQLEMSDTYGLDYESARECTPRWFGVSFGDGNNGVSHMFPDYYCRTSNPFLLATAAMIGSFKPEGKQFAMENTEIDGEADYTISAVIYDPPDCDSGDWPEDGEDMVSWSEVNGAWLICEVFPLDDELPFGLVTASMTLEGRPAYNTLDECFDAVDLALAAQV